jgi:hypothetical protein
VRPRPRARRTSKHCACGRLTPAALKRTANMRCVYPHARSQSKSGRQEEATSEATARATARSVESVEGCSLLSSQDSAVLGLSMPGRLRRSLREH